MTTKKLAAGIIILLIAAIAAGVVALNQFKSDKSKEQKEVPEEVVEEPEPEPIVNPLTGSFDFDEKTANQRVVGFVVENAPPARPQIGMRRRSRK